MWYRTYDLDTESNSRLVDLTTSAFGIRQQDEFTDVYFHGFVPEATGTFSTLTVRAHDISVSALGTAIRTFGAIYTAAEVTTTTGSKEWFPNTLLGYGAATSSSLSSDLDHAFVDVDLGVTGYPAVTRGEMYYVGLFFTSSPTLATYSSFNIYGSNISAVTQANNHLAFRWPWTGYTPAPGVVPTSFPATITSSSSTPSGTDIGVADAHADGCFWFQLTGPQTAAGAAQGPTGPTGPAGGGTSSADLVALQMTVLSSQESGILPTPYPEWDFLGTGNGGPDIWPNTSVQIYSGGVPRYLGMTTNNIAYDYFTQSGPLYPGPGTTVPLDTNALCWLSPVSGFQYNVRYPPNATPRVGGGVLSSMTTITTLGNSDSAWLVARQDGVLVGYSIEGFHAFNVSLLPGSPGLRNVPIFAGVIETSAGSGPPYLATLTGSLSTRGNVGPGPTSEIESGVEIFSTQSITTSGRIAFQAGDLLVCCYGPALGYNQLVSYPYPLDVPQVVTLYVDFS